MTDPEWQVLRPQTVAAMAELRRGPGGRPMDHRLRVVVDAVRYVVKYGVECRALPADYPDWQAVDVFYERWNARGLPQNLVDRLRARLRARAGRADLPTAAVIDSQSVKAADTVGAATSGFDGGRKIKGRKRHLAVDSSGWLLAVLVTAASVQDRDGGHRLVARLRERFSTVTLVWADSGDTGRLVVWARAVLHLSIEVVKRTDDLAGFVVVPRRWVVERTFGWLSRYRRLVRDHERKPEHHEAMVLWATTMIMTRQLAHQDTGQPAHPRSGGELQKPLRPPTRSEGCLKGSPTGSNGAACGKRRTSPAAVTCRNAELIIQENAPLGPSQLDV